MRSHQKHTMSVVLREASESPVQGEVAEATCEAKHEDVVEYQKQPETACDKNRSVELDRSCLVKGHLPGAVYRLSTNQKGERMTH